MTNLILLVLVFATATPIHCQGYSYSYERHNHGPGLSWSRIPSCGDRIKYLKLGEAHAFRSFPPHSIALQLPVPVYYSNSAQECTWRFKSMEDCQLELRTRSFERFDVDCDEQYLLIGDELHEKRFCGFARPPAKFSSTGNELFLTNFQRNGGHETIASHVGGVVRCKKRKPSPPPPQPPTCPPITQDCFDVDKMCRDQGPCLVEFSFSAAGTSSDPPASVQCNAAAPELCSVSGKLCRGSVPANGTCSDGQLPSAPPVTEPGTNCSTTVHERCPNTGNCGKVDQLLTGNGKILDHGFFRCSAKVTDRCLYQGFVCVSVKHSN